MKKINIFFICMLLIFNVTSVLASSNNIEPNITSGENLSQNKLNILENLARRKYNDCC